MFDGGNPLGQRELQEAANKWMPIIRLFLLSVNRKNGSLTCYPNDGGIFQQPNKKLQIFEYLQSLFIEKIIEANKNVNK